MIGVPFQQLANQYGLKTSQGVAYGTISGYPVTFLDGTGCHRIMVTTRFLTPSQKDILMDIIDTQDLKGLYNVKKLEIAKKVVHIVFKGVPDTMDKIPAFIDWFFPLLEQNGATKAHICPQCMEQMEDREARWVLRDGAVAFRMHELCAQELKQTVCAGNSKQAAYPEGSLGRGIAGAAIGAAVGAVLFALLHFIGFMPTLAGLVTGWLVVFLYGKLGGKRSKLRLPILILAGVLGVCLGVVLAELTALLELGAGWQVFSLFAQNMACNGLYQSAVFGDLFTGLLFAALGFFVSLRSDGRRTADLVVTDLA